MKRLKIRVLAVDDHEAGRLTIQMLLSGEEYVVYEASGGLEAIGLLPEVAPDVILLDAMMPGLDGFDTCVRIKADARFAKIPIILCTALSDQQDRNRGLQAGADDFLSKPVDRTELRLRVAAWAKVKAYHDLLENVLPRAIAQRLREEPGFVADSVDQATVLFADIKGFVAFSKSRSAAEVVEVLNAIFTAFDDHTSQAGLEKIKTIGDAYMLAGGLHPEDDPIACARRVVATGFQFFHALDAVNRRFDLSLDLRIGIHTGPLIGGVIGTRRLAYDLWGDTVNVASRMEAHGLESHIQVSDETHRLVDEEFAFTSRGSIDVKGRGPMTTWVAKGR